jgi:hypothetical protein
MTAAFRATYSDFKLVRTRKVVQIVLEVPLEQSNAVLDVLGGMPDPSKESWVGVARLRADGAPQEAALAPQRKKDWRDLAPSQQAGIRCDEPSFVAFLREQREDDWIETRDAAECVRLICGVQSRSELGTNQKARVIWKQLDDQYQAWKALEHA